MPTETSTKGEQHPGRARRRIATALVVIGLVGATGVGTWWWVDRAHAADAAASAPASAPNVTTSPVTKQSLVDTRNVSCALGYGKATSLPAGGEGTVTRMPNPGDVVSPGQVLYALDNKPVVSLPGQTPAWRDLGAGTRGPDVAQLKAALAQLGYGTAKDLGTSEKWNPALTRAVKAMQKATGQSVTGNLPLGSVVFLGGDIRVDNHKAVLGARVSVGEELYSWTSTGRTVACTLKGADRGYVTPGAQVPVTFADGTTVTGTISTLSATPADPAASQGEGDDGLQVAVDVPADQVASQLDGASARVRLEKVLAADAVTTPVTSLIAFADGGFGVQRKNADGSLEYVPVTTGVFADTWVQITEGDLKPGDEVVVTP